MTHIQQFIEDAIKGGWERYTWEDCELEAGIVERTLLDPLAWQAVGRTRAWKFKQIHCYTCEKEPGEFVDCTCKPKEASIRQQHTFIDHLADRKDIDEALSLIEK